MAASLAAQEAIFHRSLFAEMGMDMSEPTVLWVDNMGAVECTQRRESLSRSRHIERRYLLERLGARRASSSCRGRGWGGTPRELQCRRHRHARAERRYGGSWQEGGARAASPSLQGLAPPARRPRAAGAPWEARARAARVQTAGEDLVVVVGGARTNSELPHQWFRLHIVV